MAGATSLARIWAYRNYRNQADQNVSGGGWVRLAAKPLSPSS
ncbi:hypothetical protein SAMN05444050_2433 [Afipia sp. GAS231]|nr:hypothetical protein SAMN05444050_2433 [Afipia sp. GAS231]